VNEEALAHWGEGGGPSRQKQTELISFRGSDYLRVSSWRNKLPRPGGAEKGTNFDDWVLHVSMLDTANVRNYAVAIICGTSECRFRG